MYGNMTTTCALFLCLYKTSAFLTKILLFKKINIPLFVYIRSGVSALLTPPMQAYKRY